MSEYIEKLSRIKNDISIIQDSIFFEFHKLDQEITRLKKALEIANEVVNISCHIRTDEEAEIIEERAREAQKQIKEIMEGK